MKRLRYMPACVIVPVVVVMTVLSCGSTLTLADLSARELFLKGKEKYEEQKYFDAIERFQAVVFNFPGDAIVDSAQYYLGMSYFRNEDYQLAATEFNRLAINYPSSEFFENAIFMRAVSFYESTPKHYGLDQTELEQAIGHFEDFLIDFPESGLIDQAREYLLAARTRMAKKAFNNGIVYERIGAYRAARIYYQRVIDDYTDTEFAPPATFHHALMELRLKNYSEARERLDNFVIVFGDHDLAARAREQAVKAAFLNCEEMFKSEDFTSAKTCLTQFMSDYPDDKRARKAGEYLEAIDQRQDREAQGEHAGT